MWPKTSSTATAGSTSFARTARPSTTGSKATQAKGTLQLGEPAWIAERTGAAVVSDVRNRDIASGGHGAPLASLLDVLLVGLQPGGAQRLAQPGRDRQRHRRRPRPEPMAFDIGPANALMDAVGRVAHRWETRATTGTVPGPHAGPPDEALVDRLLDDPYFSLPPPKSTGKEYFNLGYVRRRLRWDRMSAEDLLASVTAATAEMVALAVAPLRPQRAAGRRGRYP